jgi:hypothetical protein
MKGLDVTNITGEKNLRLNTDSASELQDCRVVPIYQGSSR